MKRSTLSGYENKVAQPGIDTLVAFSEYFNIAVDTLIKVDLAELSEYHLNQLERGFDVFIKGSNLRVLTTTIDSQNNENIELVNEKAKAGYGTGFADPEYIKVLPAFHLPFLSRSKNTAPSNQRRLHAAHPRQIVCYRRICDRLAVSPEPPAIYCAYA